MEYVEAVPRRYFGGSKKEKGKILDEFTKVTGYHREAAIRLIRWDNQPRTGYRRGRPQQYGAAVAGALRVAWEAGRTSYLPAEAISSNGRLVDVMPLN